MNKTVVSLLVSSCTLLTASLSFAAESSGAPAQATSASTSEATAPSTMGGTVSLLGALGYGYNFSTALGVGLRTQIALVPDGFLSLPEGMHDEFAIEPGFDYFHSGYDVYGLSVSYNEFTPLVGAVWNFWLNDSFVVYPKIDLGFRIAFASATVNGQDAGSYTAGASFVYFQGALGAAYQLGPVAFRAEVGWQALRVGVGVSLF